jgi:hypothetical protein
MPPPCNERLPTAQRRHGAGPKHKHKQLASSMPRRDNIRGRWDTTDSENEDPTSYIIPFPDIPSSQEEFEVPGPIQYQHERTKTMLVQLLQKPENPVFISFGENLYRSSDVICFEIGDGKSNCDNESNKNIEALIATFLRSHIVGNS